MSDPKKYTVGWICALSTEYTAAQVFLDEKHEAPDDLSSADSNHYTCGKIGKHNVVIAVLPDGEYGLSSAATVAKDMTHSFPNVRIGLMVGIGGGAPNSKNDIRLGDVVVSAPRHGKGGVFQYDFGKTIQGQPFETTGILNQPPTALRTALSGLQSQYEQEGHQLEESISIVLEKKPRLRKKYQRPNISSDRLFQSEFIHSDNDAESCGDICLRNGQSFLISRPERPDDEDNPVIHYGLIASANNLMKDALIRDKLAAEHGILCFEMEAAGLINHFPCLVIRGICDYSDSHKNKEWQGYAAMMAAAYARDLLHELSPNRVEKEKTIQETLSSVNEVVLRTEANITTIKSKFDRMDFLAVLEWLTPNNQGTHQSDHLRRRQPGTGSWLIESKNYQDWRANQGQTLFCSGIPGAGKTILSAIVIEDLTAHCLSGQFGLAYVYCDYMLHSEQKVEDLLATILKQLAIGAPEILFKLRDRHEGKGTYPSLSELTRALRSVAASYSRVFIVVDAVDECQKLDDCRNVFLSQLFSFQEDCYISLFATSRPIPEIAERFTGDHMDIRAHKSDLQKYLAGRILKAGSVLLKRFEEEIIGRIIEVADGMFLLAQLHFDSIKTKMTAKQVINTLRNLSGGLDAYDLAYDDAKGRIETQDRDSFELAMNVLLWTCCAKRPLQLKELQVALAVEENQSSFDTNNITEAIFIVSVCAGLVTVDEESQVVRLIHHTTQDYFKRKHNDWFCDGESRLTTTCVTVLSMYPLESSLSSPIGSQISDVSAWDDELSAFYIYASQNWGRHARQAETDIPKAIMNFLSKDKSVDSSAAYLEPQDTRLNTDLRSPVITNATAMHLMAYFGLEVIASTLLEQKYPFDQRDSWGETPLMWAAQEGQSGMIALLLQHGANFNLQTPEYGITSLSFAAERGCERSVQLLLEIGANMELQDGVGYSPLFHAIANQNGTIVQLLLEKGACINTTDYHNITPLQCAIRIEDESIVRTLLENGADVNDQRGQNPTALSLAANLGNERIVQALVEKGASVDQRNGVSKSALDLARSSGQGWISAFPPVDGADSELNWEDGSCGLEADDSTSENEPDFEDPMNLVEYSDVSIRPFAETALFSAAISGNANNVQLLLDMGADINLQDAKGRTSLSSTINYMIYGFFRLVSVKGAYMGLHSDDTALIDSAVREHERVIKLLLDWNPNLNLLDYKGQTSLFSAVTHCTDAIVKDMLEKGACYDLQDTNGQTPLFNAVQRGHGGVIQLLLDKGARINLQDTRGRTPLIHAMVHAGKTCDYSQRLQMDAMVRFLDGSVEETGTESDLSDLLEETSCVFDNSRHTLKELRPKTIGLLLNGGADPALQDHEGRTALSFAAEIGEETFIKPLCEMENNIDIQDKEGRTPLLHALISKSLALSAIEELNQGTGLYSVMLAGSPGACDTIATEMLRPLENTVDILLECGANIELRDKAGQTALFYATISRDEKSVQILLQMGANLHVEDQYGQTPFFAAIACDRRKIIQLFLDAGVDCDVANKAGQTPLIYAASGGHKSSLKTLLKAGANPDATDKAGRTPLSYAAKSWNLSIMKRLLETGASPDLRDSHGGTPISHGADSLANSDVPRLLKRVTNLKNDQSREALLEFIKRVVRFNLARKSYLLARKSRKVRFQWKNTSSDPHSGGL